MIPAKWKELQDLHNTITDTRISRLPDVQIAYEEYKKTDDYVQFGPETIREKAVDTELNLLERDFPNAKYAWVILKNEYPYHVEDGVGHYVAWFMSSDISSDGHHLSREVISVLHAWLDITMCDTSAGYATFQNSAVRSTIHTVPHLQLFIKDFELKPQVIPC